MNEMNDNYTHQCVTRVTQAMKEDLEFLKQEWGMGEAQIIRAAIKNFVVPAAKKQRRIKAKETDNDN